MSRVLVLVDGEHHPPVVRAAIEDLRGCGDEVVCAVFCGGGEKLGSHDLAAAYGVPVEGGPDPVDALRTALGRHRPEAVVDLSDDPVLTPELRFRLASWTLHHGIPYRAADVTLTPPPFERILTKPSIRVIALAKRTGKTAISAALARRAAASGYEPVIVAMGRGGPPAPQVLEPGRDLSPEALLALADEGHHAASDYIEDALTTGVTTVGCRRVGGGLAGAPFRSNVAEGARIAEGRPEDLVILEGSGAAIPPVEADAGIVCVSAMAGAEAVLGPFALYRLLLGHLVVVTMAEDQVSTDRVEAAIREMAPEVPVLRTIFRPRPLQPVRGRRVFFCTTAPPRVARPLVIHLEKEHGCEVVGVSHNLANRATLEAELRAAPAHEVLLCELKAAAVDVAARIATDGGCEIVFCDNPPMTPDEGTGPVEVALDRVVERAAGERRRSGDVSDRG